LTLPTALPTVTIIEESDIQQDAPVLPISSDMFGELDEVEPERYLENDIVFESDDTPRIRIEAETSSAFFAPPHLFAPNPQRAVMFSAFFPGLGQMYNRKFWKLPMVYGGFLGFAYAISWNNGTFRDFQAAYRDIRDPNPNANSWHNFLMHGTDPDTVDKAWLTNILGSNRDRFRHYRDMAIILSVAWYLLIMIDAYVDARLFSFDMSPDLAMRVTPIVINRGNHSSGNIRNASYGFQWSFNF
jgi:hypothetical protein